MVQVEQKRSVSGKPQWLIHQMLSTVLFCFLLIRPDAASASCGLCVTGTGGFSTCCASAAEAAAYFTSCNGGMTTIYLGCPDVSNLPPDIGMWYTPFTGYVTCTNCDPTGTQCSGGTVFFGTCEDPCKGKDPCECDPDLCNKCPDETSAGH